LNGSDPIFRQGANISKKAAFVDHVGQGAWDDQSLDLQRFCEVDVEVWTQ
jgi:hypothetical protein